MPINGPKTEIELNTRQLSLRFSPEVREAFHSLAEAVRGSNNFDPETYETLQAWGKEKQTNVHAVITSLPLIAEQMVDHLKVADDPKMTDAWRELCIKLHENGFSVFQPLQRGR